MKIKVLLLFPVLFVLIGLMCVVGLGRLAAWAVKSLLDLVGAGLARVAVDLCAAADPLVPGMATRRAATARDVGGADLAGVMFSDRRGAWAARDWDSMSLPPSDEAPPISLHPWATAKNGWPTQPLSESADTRYARGADTTGSTQGSDS